MFAVDRFWNYPARAIVIVVGCAGKHRDAFATKWGTQTPCRLCLPCSQLPARFWKGELAICCRLSSLTVPSYSPSNVLVRFMRFFSGHVPRSRRLRYSVLFFLFPTSFYNSCTLSHSYPTTKKGMRMTTSRNRPAPTSTIAEQTQWRHGESTDCPLWTFRIPPTGFPPLCQASTK